MNGKEYTIEHHYAHGHGAHRDMRVARSIIAAERMLADECERMQHHQGCLILYREVGEWKAH